MPRRFVIVFVFAAAAMGTMSLWADDVYLTNPKNPKHAKAVITGESTKGIVLKNGDKYAAEEIDDIFYELGPSAPAQATISYSTGFNQERVWAKETDAKKRAAAYNLALDGYEKAASQITDKKPKAHLDFKLGYLRAKKALEDGSDPKNAISRLRDFATKNPAAWETVRALLLLAQLQMDTKDYPGADLTFGDLQKLDVSEEIRQDAKIQQALIGIPLKKYNVVEPKLEQLLKEVPKGSKNFGRILVALAECKIANNKTQEAVDLLKQSIKESEDKNLRAIAYNTLGAHYYNADQLKEARWEFLFVDVVYNQDKNQHARALYYLSHIFDKLADPDKAAQCRAVLLDPGYAGTEFQRKLQAEQKK